MTAERMMRQQALRFIVTLGLLSLFAGMVYEGARSILGPFLVTSHAGCVHQLQHLGLDRRDPLGRDPGNPGINSSSRRC